MITSIYLYELEVTYINETLFRHTYPTLEKALEGAWRKYEEECYGSNLLKKDEFERIMTKKQYVDEGIYSFDITRVRQEVNIPKVNNPTTVGDIVCGGFDAALEYTIYHGVHEDGDVLWTSEVNGPLTPDDAISNYVVTYMTIDWANKRLIIETL